MKLMIGLMMLFFSSIAYSQDDTIPPPNDAVEVKVVNESLNVIVLDTINPVELIGPMFTPSQLRSAYRKVTVPPKSTQTGRIHFNEPVLVQEVSVATGQVCDRIAVRISINEMIAKLLPVSVGSWKPPGRIVLGAGVDYIKYELENVQVTAYDTKGPKKEPCVVEFVVFAVTPPKKVDNGF